MLEGLVNKIGFLIVLLSACCWVTYVTGFSLRYQQLDARGSNDSVVKPTYFCHWCLCVSGVPVYFLILLHVMCGNLVTAVATLSLVPLYLVSVGGVLNYDGQYLYDYYSHPRPNSIDYQDYVWVEFGGALGALFFCWVTMVMWSWYSYARHEHGSSHRDGYERL